MSVQEPPLLRAGHIVAELFDSEVPKTVENFRCLCTGEKGLGKSSKKPLHLKVSLAGINSRGFEDFTDHIRSCSFVQ